MNPIRFARPVALIALCATLPLAGCVVPGSAPYGAYAAQPAYAQPQYAQQPQYQQPQYQQPQYQQPQYAQPAAQYPQPGDEADAGNAYQQSQPQPQAGYDYQQEYGVVSAIQPLANPNAVATGGVAGTIVGGVLGGVIGNQFGHGHGRDAATVIGALGGAVAGNQLGQQAGASSPGGYRISVQLSDGSTRAFDVGAPGDLRPGDRVRIAGNRLDRY